jgi:hypothetical protein
MADKYGDVDLGIIIREVEKVFARSYPDARDISMVVEGVDFAKGLSDPYTDKSGGDVDVVADYVDRMNFRLRIIVNHKRRGGTVL